MRIAPRSPALFVGRTEELARLLDTADRLRLATVCGVGGIGKTALLLRAAELQCERVGGELAYHACRDGESVASVLAAVRAQLADASVGADRTRPLVAVIDDVHRVRDPLLVEALVRIALQRLPIWIWLGSREVIALDPAAIDHVALRLDALSADDAERLWAELVQMYGAPAQACERSRRSPLQLKQAFGGVRDATDRL